MNSAETLIIGSGPSGISAAWPLVLAGREVALVDGINQSMPLPPAMSIRKFREDPASWKYIYGSDLSGLHIDKNISPKFATPIGQRLLADDGFESQLNLRDFFGQRALMPGGQSLVWGAFCSTFDNKDLMEFPVNQSDLMDGYKSVASRIGLSGGNDDMGEFHGTYYDLHHPPALNSLIADVYDRYKKIKFDPNEFKLGLARNAVITRNVDGREGCNECGLCLYGCSRNSIYSSDLEIEKLNKFPNFKYFPNSVVSKLISLDGVNKKIEINRSSIVDVRRLVLAAGTISSTALILEYAGFYRTKIPLLSNPCAAMAFIMPKYIQTNFPEKSFGLGQLSYRLGLNPEEDYVTGVLYAADTLPLDVFARHLPFTSLVAFKLTSAILPAIMPVTAYLSSKFSHNYLSIDRNGKNVEIILEGNRTAAAERHIFAARNRLVKYLKKCGAYYVPSSLKFSPPGGDAHLAGTIPMGGDGILSSSKFGELNLAKNVYVVDGSALPSLPAKHCSFTIMANAHRIGRFLAEN